MNKWRLGGGTLCLAFAALLAILNEVRPEGTVVFMVDGVNMPLVPIIGLTVIGLVLLVTACKWQRVF